MSQVNCSKNFRYGIKCKSPGRGFLLVVSEGELSNQIIQDMIDFVEVMKEIEVS